MSFRSPVRENGYDITLDYTAGYNTRHVRVLLQLTGKKEPIIKPVDLMRRKTYTGGIRDLSYNACAQKMFVYKNIVSHRVTKRRSDRFYLRLLHSSQLDNFRPIKRRR